MSREFGITMLGAERTGKTSLLASVCYQLNQIGQGVDLQIKPVGEAANVLSNYISCLEQTLDTTSRIPRNNGEMIPSTHLVDVGRSDLLYRFDLGRVGKEPKVQLAFRDFPGVQLLDRKTEVVQRVRECAVTMITVDTPALMVEKSKSDPWTYHNTRNIPFTEQTRAMGMYEIFKSAYSELAESRLVLLVPIKCERWVHDARSSAALLARLQTGYRLLLGLLADHGLERRVAVVVTPVQTLGNLEYAYMDRDDVYSPRYLKESPSSIYEPRDCDQPLRYALRFVLQQYLKNPGFRDGLVYNWFGGDKPFKTAIEQFAKGCKPETGDQAGGFAILQGKHLL